MKKFYIPTTSLNFNNILSSESVSPKAFYAQRGFGYQRWETIPENPLDNSITLYDELCYFERPVSDYEDHPLLIEVYLDEDTVSTFIKVDAHTYLYDQTIYLDPFSSSFLFFNDNDKRIALSMSESSIETKLIKLYYQKIQTISFTGNRFQLIDMKNKHALNVSAIEKDKRINRMKGLLYGYYIGALLSSSKETIVKLNAARQILNIYAAILSSIDHKPTSQQIKQLQFLLPIIQQEVPLFKKINSIITDNSLFAIIVNIIRDEYGYIKGEYNVDTVLTQLLTPAVNSNPKNIAIEHINGIINNLNAQARIEATPVNVDDGEILVIDNALASINLHNMTLNEKKLLKALVNEVFSKDEYNGKTSTFKEKLSDDITIKAKELSVEEWKGSYAEVTLNNLRRHVRGEDFNYTWNDNLFSAISSVVVRGDDWQKLQLFMQLKEMTDYRLAYAIYGTLNGFANLPRSFTDVLYNCKNRYVADVYKEFYGQLFGKNVFIAPKPEKIVCDTIYNTDIKEPIQKEIDIINAENLLHEEFTLLMNELNSICKTAINDEKKYRDLFFMHKGLNQHFVSSVCDDDYNFNKGKGVQKKIKDYLKTRINPQKKMKSKKEIEVITQDKDLFTDSNQSTGCFLSDYQFLLNNLEFSSLMSGINNKWQKDLKWFIDAHNPMHKDYSYYKGKSTDNKTVIDQFIGLHHGRYKTAESFLCKIYNI